MKNLNGTDIDRIIEMAWEDRTTFDAILETGSRNQGKAVKALIALIRNDGLFSKLCSLDCR